MPLAVYSVVHLERYQLGLSYPEMVEKVAELLRRPAMQAGGRPAAGDRRDGGGAAVVDQFLGAKLAAEVVPITITAGDGGDEGLLESTHVVCFRVAKLDLVAAARVALDARRLKIAPTLPLASTLVKELQNYQVKVTAPAPRDVQRKRRCIG